MRYHLRYLDQVRLTMFYSSINHFQSGPSSGTSSTERGASYLVAPRSLCDSEHYTDSGIHHTDSNGMEDEQLIQNDREVRHILGNWSSSRHKLIRGLSSNTPQKEKKWLNILSMNK